MGDCSERSGAEIPHVREREVRPGVEVPHVGDRDVRTAKVPHVGDLDRSVVQREALLALTALGFKKREAERALAAAEQLMTPAAGLEALLRAALRELR